MEKTEKKLPYQAMIYWNVTDYCNYSCPQCVGHAPKIKGKYAPQSIHVPQLKNFLAGFNYKLRFHLTGGEPLIVENIVEAMEAITQNHYFSLVSNLSTPAVVEMANKINPEKVELIIASAHTIELEKNNSTNSFISYCQLLLNKGFNLKVTEVGYPFRINKVHYYKELFRDNGINLLFDPFRGDWKGKQYPEAYTDEEKSIFNFDDFMPMSSSAFKRFGQPCNAGYNIAVANSEGKLQPCIFVHKEIGNLYDNKVNIGKNLINCPLEFCACPFPVFFPDLFEIACNKCLDNEHV